MSAASRLLPKAQLIVSTNGFLLTRERAHALKSAGADSVQLTLLAPDPDLHDGLVAQPGAFRKSVGAIAHAKSAGLVVAVFFVATRRNIERWPGTAKLALAVGADTVVFNRFQPGGRSLANWRDLTPTPAQLARAHQQIVELRDVVGIQLGTILPPCELHERRPAARIPRGTAILSCPIGTRNAYPAIGPDGRLRPCNHWPTTIGNVLDTALDDLVRVPMSGLLPEGSVPPECEDCRWVRRCKGGCPAVRQLAGDAIYCLRPADDGVCSA